MNPRHSDTTIGHGEGAAAPSPAAGPPSEAVPGLGSRDPRAISRSRWTSLPADVMRGVRARVKVLTLAVGAIWALTLLVDDVLAHLLGHVHTPDMGWPWPGRAIAATGLVVSLATWAHTRRQRCDSHNLVNAALAFQLVTALLVAIQTNWTPNMGSMRVSWLCVVILVTPAIVPVPPLKTLLVSLLIATMDPIAVGISVMRGALAHPDPYLTIWYFLPNYVCVALALIPSTLISGLGRRVNEARELGAYQLGELIGRGGMGEVYRARHRLLARPAAIKLIRPETLGANGSKDGGLVIQRFHREAQAAASLQSPHTIGLYDFGVTEEGTFYYVMELLDGLDLETLVRQHGPVPPERAVQLLRQACRSLGEAHARGLIHRDVKPSNIFTCRFGLNVDFVKVLDFGLVKVAQDAETSTPGQTAALLTNPDVTTGTPAYMAPEMALGEREVDRRADIYALGCVGYWLLTGRLVFEADTPVKMMLKHIQTPPVAPSESSELEIPGELDRVILACLAKDPDGRPADAMALTHALEKVPLQQRWNSVRAEQWWDVHHPAPAPMTELRPPTPAGNVHAVK